jgi:hypothetical protein
MKNAGIPNDVDPTMPPAVLTAEWVAGTLLSDLGLAAYNAGFCTVADAASLIEKYAAQRFADAAAECVQLRERVAVLEADGKRLRVQLLNECSEVSTLRAEIAETRAKLDEILATVRGGTP